MASIKGVRNVSMTMTAKTREKIIAKEVGVSIDDLLNESLYWSMPDSEPVKWFELRDAIIAKLLDVAHEQGRQELHAEQVRDNCI